MEHISKHLPQVPNKLVPSNYLTKQETITSDERQIISNKYASPRFGKMLNDDLIQVARVLLLKLHVITGWAVPVKELKDILVDQFAKKLREDYADLNADELEYAFRKNTSVQDWGKNMNLILIDDVLQPFLEQRREISAKEEYQKMNRLPAGCRWPKWEIDRDYAFYLAQMIDKRIKAPLKKIINYDSNF